MGKLEIADIVASGSLKLGAYNAVNMNLSFFLVQNTEVDIQPKNRLGVRGEATANAISNEYLNPYFSNLGLAYASAPVELSLPRTVGLDP